MKVTIYLAFVLLLANQQSMAQTPYTTQQNDRKETILNGIITKYALLNTTPFSGWYSASQASYPTNSPLLQALQTTNGKVHFIIFGGTWCEDTQQILPKFFKLQELAGVSDKAISFYGVDRSKHTLGGLDAAFNITNVPTIIIMKGGKELGRVIEYGKTGKWDVELAQLLTL